MKIIELSLAFIILLLIVDGAAIDRTEDISILFNKMNISNNFIDYNGVIINGNLSLYPSGKHVIESSIRFMNSRFNGIVDLSNMEFKEKVIFNNVTFKNYVKLSGTHFCKDSEFYNCTFSRGLISNYTGGNDYTIKFDRFSNFSKSIFRETADFTHAQFNGNAEFEKTSFRNAIFEHALFKGSHTSFLESTFKDSAVFNFAQFRGEASFSDANANNASFSSCNFYRFAAFNNCTFANYVKFSKSKFYAGCDFSDSDFNDSAFFNLVIFNKTTNFKRTTFAKDAGFQNSIFANEAISFDDAIFLGSNTKFSNVQFLGQTGFERSQFKGNADFSSSKFINDAYFYRSIFKKDANFKGAEFNADAFFDDVLVDGTLNLIKTEYNKLYVKLENINEIKYNETAYKSLIENFKKLGLFGDAYGCYYRFMKAYAYENLAGFKIITELNNELVELENNSIIGPLINSIDSTFISIYYLFAWTLYGFGTKPEFTLFWSFFLIMIFGSFWYHVGQSKTKDLYDEYDWREYRDKHHQESDSKTKILAVIDPFLFSATIFLSGTKFFIDPPQIPESFDKSTPLVNRAYSLERILGGIFSLLFFVAIGSMIFSM